MLQQLQQLFHSITKSLDVLYVMEDIKPCARILVHEDSLGNAAAFLKEKNIFCEISEFKVIKKNLQSEFYSDKSIKVPKNSEEKGHLMLYLSKNKETAQNAKITEEKMLHKDLGLILGYPKCCCDFFEKNFDAQNTDLTLKALQNSDGYEFPFYTNIAMRHLDFSLLSHFPHDFGCKESIEIAKRNLKIIEKYSQDFHSMFVGMLQGMVIYTMNEGIFLLRKHEKTDGKILYSDILTTAKSKLYYFLSSAKELVILNKNCIMIGSEEIKEIGVMIFT